MQAAAQVGLTPEQIDNIFKRGKATFKVGHSVVYSGQGAAPDVSAFAGTTPPPGFSQQVGSRHQVAQARRRPLGLRGWPDRIGAIVGTLGICIGAAASLTATMPSSALWTSPFVCDRECQLAYDTANYSYKPGQSGTSVSFECVGATGSYEPNWLLIDTFQTVLCALVLGAAVGARFHDLASDPPARLNVSPAGWRRLRTVRSSRPPGRPEPCSRLRRGSRRGDRARPRWTARDGRNPLSCR